VKKSGAEILQSLSDKMADIRQVFSSGCCEEKRRFYDLYLIRRQTLDKYSVVVAVKKSGDFMICT